MMGSNCTVEDYSAWRREQVEEAADLARCIGYHEQSGWQRIQEIYTEARRARRFSAETHPSHGGLSIRSLIETFKTTFVFLRLL